MDFNAITRYPLAAAVGRLFGVDNPTTSVISSEIQQTTSPWERPEFWALLGGSLSHGSWFIAAQAGQIGTAQVLNPASSGVLLIVEQLKVYNSNVAPSFLSIGMNTGTVLATLTTSLGNRDSRRARPTGAPGALASVIRTQYAAIPTGLNQQIVTFLLDSGQIETFDLDLVLAPGASLIVQPTTVNEINNAYVRCRERPAPDTELNLG